MAGILRRSRGAGAAGADASSPAARCGSGRSPRQRAGAAAARCRTWRRCCARPGYEVAYKGKWHLTHPIGGGTELLGGWGEPDAELIERDYGFADWEAPDAGENAKAEHFGGGNAGEGEGWDEVYTRQAEEWLGRAELPEPFCLVVSLVNPHDVLGYPGLVPARRLRRATSSATSASSCRRPSTRT